MNFKGTRQLDRGWEIDLTPLIDVVFLLLIFFMVSTTFKAESKLLVELPQASQRPPTEVEPLITLSLDKSGILEYKGNVFTASELADALKTLSGNDADKPVLIRADHEVQHGVVVSVLDTLRQSGFTSVSIATRTKKKM